MISLVQSVLIYTVSNMVISLILLCFYTVTLTACLYLLREIESQNCHSLKYKVYTKFEVIGNRGLLTLEALPQAEMQALFNHSKTGF